MTPLLDIDAAIARSGLEVDVQCAAGPGITALVGPSGAGKTTLLHLVAGLLRPRRGRIVLGGRVLTEISESADTHLVPREAHRKRADTHLSPAPARRKRADTHLPPHRRGVAVVFQDGRLLPHYRILGNLLYGCRGMGGRNAPVPASARLDEVVDLLDLAPLLGRRPAELSGGERQRVAIGRALLATRHLLLLDEPLTGLDFALRARVLAHLRRLGEQPDLAIIHVSHHLHEALQLTSRMIVIEAGRVTGSGAYHDLALGDTSAASMRRLGLTNVLRLRRDAEGWLIDAPAGGPGPPRRLALTGGAAASSAGPFLRVSIRPEDVALAARPIDAISIQNQIAGTVRRLHEHDGQVLVEINVGQPLLASVTTAAVNTLEIHPGRETWALIKSSAIVAPGGEAPG